METMLTTLGSWTRRRWLAAGVSGMVIAVLIALPTAVIPNPVFGRSMGVTWWSYPVVVLTGILGGLLFATYVNEDRSTDQGGPGTGTDAGADPESELDRPTKLGMTGTLISFFAIGCPVCNKLVLLALGTSGAVTWFAPVQPVLALASIVAMAVALRMRLRSQQRCPVSR